MAAILATTDDEIDVVPCSLVSAAPPPPERSKLRDDGRSTLRDGAWSAVASGRPAAAGVAFSAELAVGVGFSGM